MRLDCLVVWLKSAVQSVTLWPASENASAIDQNRWGRKPSSGRLSNGFSIQTVMRAYAAYLSTPKRYSVTLRNVSPGRSTVEGKSERFGESG